MPAGVVTIAAVGDIVMGSTPNLPPDGGRSFFDGVQTDLAGDVVLGNLEGTLSVGGGSKCGAGSTNCYAFQTPPSYAAWLKQAGFTVMNLANNHAYDYGPSGQAQTLAALEEAATRDHGPPRRDRLPAGRRDQGRARRLRPVLVGAVADRHPGGPAPRQEGRRERGRRHRHDARRARRAPTTRTCGREPRRTSARTAATSSRSPMRSSKPARTSSSAAALTSCAGWSGTRAV